MWKITLWNILSRHWDQPLPPVPEFSAAFHTSPLQYLQEKKIEAAKSLLLSTDDPIHEVGSMVGIDNTNHFIHLFKKAHWCHTLCLPTERAAVYT